MPTSAVSVPASNLFKKIILKIKRNENKRIYNTIKIYVTGHYKNNRFQNNLENENDLVFIDIFHNFKNQ